MDVNIIAALGKHNEIGKDGKLIWKLPKDLKFFKEKTMGKYVIMGRKTFESLPNDLPGRKMIVISKNNVDDYWDVICFHSLSEALKSLKSEDVVYIIGGQSIFEQALPIADNMYLTHIDEEDFYADTYFPSFDKKDWTIQKLDSGVDNGYEYKRNRYIRKKVK